MTKALAFTLAWGLSVVNVVGQDFSTYVKNNAVPTDQPGQLNIDVYKLLADFKLIMIGEMHGTNEPAQLVIKLAELLAHNGDSVQVGLEIPAHTMTTFITRRSNRSIYAADFFAKQSNDGRASFAWAEIISTLHKNPKVRIFFYDTNDQENKSDEDRDSLMYLKVKREIQAFPNWKMITLSGNIHNMILPYKGKPKMARYLIHDNDLNISRQVCTLNHAYQNGMMLNNTGSGLALQQVNNPASIYTQAVDYDRYLLLFPANHIDKRYSGIYFTKVVSAAKMVQYK